MLERGMRSPNAETYVEQGRALIGELAAAIHERRDPGPEVEATSREYLRVSREKFREAPLGKAIRQAGYGDDPSAAVAAMSRGELDPFA